MGTLVVTTGLPSPPSGNLSIVLPLEFGEELAETRHTFADRYVLGAGAARRSVAHQDVEQPILQTGHSVAHVCAVLSPLSGIDAYSNSPAPALHRFQRLGRAVHHRDIDAELLGEGVEAGEIRAAGKDDRRCAESPCQFEDLAPRRRVSRHTLDAIRADAHIRSHAGANRRDLGIGQIVIEILLHLGAHPLRARRLDERHEHRIGADH